MQNDMMGLTIPEWIQNSIVLIGLFLVSMLVAPLMVVVCLVTSHFLVAAWLALYSVYVWSKYVHVA